MIDESWYNRPASIPIRISAGGVVTRVVNRDIYVALVREVERHNFLLPKGGVEVGESLEIAARREIEEEAGLTELELMHELGVRERLTYEKRFWNKTHYFLFRTYQIAGTPTDTERSYQLAWY